MLDGKLRLASGPGSVDHGNAIHGHPVEGRKVAVGRKTFGQDAPGCLRQRQRFGGERAGGGKHPGKSFGDGYQISEQ
jgi:hypothetical protein